MSVTARAQSVGGGMPSFETMLDGLPDPILLIDRDGVILHANSAGRESFGADSLGRELRDLFPLSPAEFDPSATFAPLILTWGGELEFDGRINGVDADHLVVSLRPRHPAARALGAADLDELTGLVKRTAVMGAIEGCLAAEGGFAVHCLDLDRFKVINDTLGHGVGDLLLAKVADRLRSACRASDLVARIGGDEFVVLQRGTASGEDAERLARRIVDLVGRTYVINGHTINIGVSVGVALRGEHRQARDVLRDADLALYEAKRAGKGRHRVFEPAMSVSLQERRELEIDLRRALALRQFELNFQPFVELDTNEVKGFEALLRWKHPVRGNVPPLSFIPMAEETGLIVKIGEWVLRSACEAAASWPDEMSVAVNVSPIQFKTDHLLETVRSALERSGLAPQRLELEITESALLDDTSNVLVTLHALRELGVAISMDDFGTGYSSLSYLQKFPFTKIKIDRSFVAGETEDSRAILKAVAGLGSSLGMAITAEGVETSEQLSRIKDQRCTHVQGYFTGRPMTGDRIDDFLRTHHLGGRNG